jgi:hypothetical protein
MSRHIHAKLALAALTATGLGVPMLAQSVAFPTYQVGENKNGSKGPNYPSTLRGSRAVDRSLRRSAPRCCSA